jgi:hypothetical protein
VLAILLLRFSAAAALLEDGEFSTNFDKRPIAPSRLSALMAKWPTIAGPFTENEAVWRARLGPLP